jgi:hypothetical protein
VAKPVFEYNLTLLSTYRGEGALIACCLGALFLFFLRGEDFLDQVVIPSPHPSRDKLRAEAAAAQQREGCFFNALYF